MTLIAFSGRLGSGKDTAGERLAAMVSDEITVTHASFARLLKESAAALFDIPTEDWETYKNDPDVKILLQIGWEQVYEWASDGGAIIEQPKIIKEFTAREILQRYGTESHREIFGDDFWVDQALSGYIPSIFNLTYVTDCRFKNEAEAILNHGGIVIRVIGTNEETGAHASETPLPDEYVTYEISNTVRDDNFQNLDTQLKSLSSMLGIRLKKEVLV